MSPYPAIWKMVERSWPKPQRYTGMMVVEFDDFSRRVMAGDHEFAHDLVHALYAGKAILLRRAFTEEWMRLLRLETIHWTRTREPSFHKMVDGAPDFHRMIDAETGKRYAFGQCKHSAYFFRWNDDPLSCWPEITRVWRPIKVAMGLEAETYERNLPSDGPVDRVQIVRYPPSIGYLAPHQDPEQDQRCFISAYMSKRGADFDGGGFYFVGRHDEVVDAESMFSVGDVCLGYATVMHGVAPCDRHKVADWQATDGRWFLGLYSNSPDTGVKRNTGKPVALDLPGVLP